MVREKVNEAEGNHYSIFILQAEWSFFANEISKFFVAKEPEDLFSFLFFVCHNNHYWRKQCTLSVTQYIVETRKERAIIWIRSCCCFYYHIHLRDSCFSLSLSVYIYIYICLFSSWCLLCSLRFCNIGYLEFVLNRSIRKLK